MLGPLDVSPVISRIRDQVADLRSVGGAADQAAIDAQRLPPMPCAFVTLAGEEITTTKLSGGVVAQTARAVIDVLVGVRHARVAGRGMAHAEAGIALVNQIRGALVAWNAFLATPPDGDATLGMLNLSGRGQLVRLDQDLWWWIDRYQLTYRGRVAAQ
jgi:hypothetical protein